MALFEDRAESEVERAIALVEEAIRGLGLDPEKARAASGGRSYALRRGSAQIAVTVHPGDGTREGTLRVAAPVVRLPSVEAQRNALLLYVLELNARELVGAAFGVVGEELVVVSERLLRDLDRSEVDAAIRGVGRLADTWDDVLSSRFGARRSSDPST
jgi:hypothetical protein